MTTAPQAVTGDWVRFVWDLRSMESSAPLPQPYRAGRATSDQFSDVVGVVVAAYASDPTWARIIDRIRDRMRPRIAETLGKPGAAYITVAGDGELVAVSGVATQHWTDQTLLTGICVIPGHQRRGIGTWLLGASLRCLREMGLDSARVYTEAGSLADRKIYPLYGGRREDRVTYPGAAASKPDSSTRAISEEPS